MKNRQNRQKKAQPLPVLFICISVLLQYMYTQGFVNGNFGYAMAITVFTLAISVALSMLSRKLTDASEGGQ